MSHYDIIFTDFDFTNFEIIDDKAHFLYWGGKM